MKNLHLNCIYMHALSTRYINSIFERDFKIHRWCTNVSFPYQNMTFYQISYRGKKEDFEKWEFSETKFSHSCRIHYQNSSKHDKIFQKLTFPIKEVLLLFFLENCLFFSVWTDPYFKAHEALTWNEYFFFHSLVGDRHTLATSTSLASVQPWTVFNSIAPILSVWTASKKTFVSFCSRVLLQLTCTRPL